jgi:dolichol-phosphate mannosyltransferase
MFHEFKVSVVMPAYNEAEGIEAAVRTYAAIPEVDEVLVVDNNSTDGTDRIAVAAGARIINEPRQGYGYACQAGLMSASGEIVFLVEPDGTFQAGDIYKFLAYADDFDVVFGTRTAKTCIWAGSNMGHFLRYGNCAVAKLLEYVHNGPCLTDVGCTYKMFKSEAIKEIAPMFSVGASHFSPELMILCIRSGLLCVEIPVNYRPRLGTSKITGDFWKAFRLGWRMIGMILAYRFTFIPKARPAVRPKGTREAGGDRLASTR